MGDVHFLQLVIAAFIECIEFYSYTCNHTNYTERIHVYEISTRCVCETQMPPIMANSKYGLGHKDK